MSLPGVGEDGGRFDIYSELLGTGEDGAGQLRLELFGTITEIGLGGAHMCRIGHRVLTAFGKSEHAVGQRFFFFVSQTVVHNIHFFYYNTRP